MKIKKSHYLIPILAALLLLAIYSYIQKGFVHFLFNQDIGATVEYIKSFGYFGAFILLLLVIIEVVIAPIPSVLLYLAGGIIYGGFYGGTIILVGNIIGAMIAFYLARTLGNEFLKDRINDKQNKRFNKFTEKYGSFAIFILRINPLTSSDLVSYLAGLTKMKASKFFLSTTLALTPLIYIQSHLGSEVIAKSPLLLYSFIAISIIYAAIIFYILFKKSKK